MATQQADGNGPGQWTPPSVDGSTDPFTFRQVVNDILYRGADASVLEERRLTVPLLELRQMEDGDLLNHMQQIYEEWQRLRVLLLLQQERSISFLQITYELWWGELRFRINGTFWLKCCLAEINFCRGLLGQEMVHPTPPTGL